MDDPQDISNQSTSSQDKGIKLEDTGKGIEKEIVTKISKTSDIEDKETEEEITFDIDLQPDEGLIDEIDVDKIIDINSLDIDNTFIVIYQEKEDLIDKLLTIKDISIEDHKVYLIDEDSNDEILLFDDRGYLIMENETYHIFEIEKVETFTGEIDDFDQGQGEEFLDIEILVEEKEERSYSLIEKKESLITELITIFNAFDNKSLIYHLIDTVDELIDMYIHSDINLIEDNDDTLLFLQKMKNGGSYEIPRWIIPIVDDQKKLYHMDDSLENTMDTNSHTINFKEEFKEKYTLLNTDHENNYRKYIHILNSYHPYQQNKEAIQIPYHGMYLRNCSTVSPCNGIDGELTFDMVRTRKELIFSFLKDNHSESEIIQPKERIALKGFYLLPHTYLDITLLKRYLTIHDLYFLSDYKYSYLSLKRRFLDEKILPLIINHKNNKDTSYHLKKSIYSYQLEQNSITYEQLYHNLINNLNIISL